MENVIIIFLLIAGAVALLAVALAPYFNQTSTFFKERLERIQSKKIKKAEQELDTMFIVVERRRLLFIYTLAPILGGIFAFFLFRSLGLSLVGFVLGLAIPPLVIKQLQVRRKRAFYAQLVDGLMILSSSLKSGLSLLQAIEVLVEEMPPPASQEFGLVLRQNKTGIPLEEAFERLNKRMPSDELNLFITAMLVAKETGGDLAVVLSRIVATIRERNKLKQRILTLTTQARWQGLIMSILPIVFAFFTYQINPTLLNTMLASEVGRGLLIYAVISEVVGVVLLRRFSRLET